MRDKYWTLYVGLINPIYMVGDGFIEDDYKKSIDILLNIIENLEKRIEMLEQGKIKNEN